MSLLLRRPPGPESASHTQLAQVGGGMKVKVVLAWQRENEKQAAMVSLMTKQLIHP